MKKFLIKISYTVLPIWLFFIIITIHYTWNIEPQISGDLGVLSKWPFGTEYNNRVIDTNADEILFKTIPPPSRADTSNCNILTLGDSFSDMQAQGYQNYICRYSDLKLNHIGDRKIDPFITAYYLLDHGLIDSSKVKHMVVEIVERDFLSKMLRFESDYSTLSYPVPSPDTHPTNLPSPHHEQGSRKNRPESPGNTPENGLSLLNAKTWLMLRSGFSKSVYTCELNRPVFSHDEYARSLFFYINDLNCPHINKENEETVKNTLDKLFHKSKMQGVNLIILIACDKYDLYQPFIINNKYPARTINEDLARIYPSPNIIISKFILQPRIYDGEKDIYLVNDSHWSYKASQLVAREILARIGKEE